VNSNGGIHNRTSSGFTNNKVGNKKDPSKKVGDFLSL